MPKIRKSKKRKGLDKKSQIAPNFSFWHTSSLIVTPSKEIFSGAASDSINRKSIFTGVASSAVRPSNISLAIFQKQEKTKVAKRPK